MLPNRTLDWSGKPVGSTDAPDAQVSWQRVNSNRTKLVGSPILIPGKYPMEFTLLAGDDPINSSGVRVEWADFRDSATRENMGTEGWYGFVFQVPLDFASPSNWFIIWQLHQAGGGSPPFALRLDNGKVRIARRDTAYGAEKYWDILPTIPRGVPVRIIMHAKWASAGYLEIWHKVGNATEWTKIPVFNGVTFYDGPGYWKSGIYAGNENINRVVYSQGMVRRQSFAEVEAWMAGSGTVPPPPDTAGPAVAVTAPTSGAILDGGSVTYHAEVSDPSGINKVSFYLGSALLGEEVNAPYGDGSPVSIANFAPGSYDFRVVALDKVGNPTTVMFPVTIPEPPPPAEVHLLQSDYDYSLERLNAVRNRLQALKDSVAEAITALDNAIASLKKVL